MSCSVFITERGREVAKIKSFHTRRLVLEFVFKTTKNQLGLTITSWQASKNNVNNLHCLRGPRGHPASNCKEGVLHWTLDFPFGNLWFLEGVLPPCRVRPLILSLCVLTHTHAHTHSRVHAYTYVYESL